MTNAQVGILAPTPKLARYLTFSLKAGAQPQSALSQLAALADGDSLAVGIGPPTGSYFWCPPMQNGKLDLRVLEL